MKNKIHVYEITMSNGEQFNNVRIKGTIKEQYVGTAPDLISTENENGETVELMKYQIVKAKLISIEE